MHIAVLTVIASSSLVVATHEPPTTGGQSVSDLAAQICPEESETKWLAIPWRVSFWQGVQDSQIDGKPILLWAMNGHPLGCT